MKIATREDVAKRAGVSVTVVSYVMNNNRCVEASKKAKVLEAAKELNYRPNSIARALSGKRSSHLLFIVDSPETERLSKMLGRLENYAYSKGSLVSLCTARNDEDFASQIVGTMFDGVIISSSKLNEKFINELVSNGIPVVLLLTHSYTLTEGVGKIGTGLKRGCIGAVHYLYNLGRKKIIYLDRTSPIIMPPEYLDSRLQGYVAGMKEIGETNCEKSIISGCANVNEMLKALDNYIKEGKVDAIIARNDRLAINAMRHLSDNGVKIPDDIAVMGFDNSSICPLVYPGLTSIALQDSEIAKTAVDMIYEMRKGIKLTETVHFSYEIIPRESTEGKAVGKMGQSDER